MLAVKHSAIGLLLGLTVLMAFGVDARRGTDFRALAANATTTRRGGQGTRDDFDAGSR